MDEITPSIQLNGTSGRLTPADMNRTKDAFQLRRQHIDVDLFWQIVPPFILLFGIFGNVMIIVICQAADVMSSMTVYFVTLAGSDLLSLSVNVVNQWSYYAFDVDFTSLHSVVCKLIIWNSYVTGVLSAWVLVAMTAQRAVCVLWPHRADILCSARNSKAIALSLMLFTAVLHCHLLYGFDVVTIIDSRYTSNRTAEPVNADSSTTNNTAMAFNDGKRTAVVCGIVKEYVEFYFSVWSWVDLLIFSVLPWLCLVVSNSVLLWTLNVSIRQAQHSLGSAHTDGFSGRKKQASSMTVTLFVVSTAFIVLHLPMSCVQLLGFYHYMAGSLAYFYQSEVIAFCNEIALAMWKTNSAVNFYLYCLTGSKFRKQLKSTYSCCTPEGSTRSGTQSSEEKTTL